MRRGAPSKRQLKVLPDAAVKMGMATLVECELFEDTEAGVILKRDENFRRVARGFTENTDECLQLHLEWTAFRVSLLSIVNERVRKFLKDQSASDSIKTEVTSTQSQLRYAVAIHTVKLTQRFHNDRKLELTVMDILLRLGETRLFDNFVSKSLMSNPHDLLLWKLLVKRKIAVGDYIDALTILQRCQRFNKDPEVDVLMRKLALIVAVVNKVHSMNHEEAPAVKEQPAVAEPTLAADAEVAAEVTNVPVAVDVPVDYTTAEFISLR